MIQSVCDTVSLWFSQFVIQSVTDSVCLPMYCVWIYDVELSSLLLRYFQTDNVTSRTVQVLFPKVTSTLTYPRRVRVHERTSPATCSSYVSTPVARVTAASNPSTSISPGWSRSQVSRLVRVCLVCLCYLPSSLANLCSQVSDTWVMRTVMWLHHVIMWWHHVIPISWWRLDAICLVMGECIVHAAFNSLIVTQCSSNFFVTVTH